MSTHLIHVDTRKVRVSHLPLLKENLKGFEKSENLMEVLTPEHKNPKGEPVAGKMLVFGLYAGPVPAPPGLADSTPPTGGDPAWRLTWLRARGRGRGRGRPAAVL